MSSISRRILAIVLLSGAVFGSPVHAQNYRSIVASSDRTAADRENDKKRQPLELLEFIAPKTGWRVLDMAAGAGYSTELLARAVSPDGKVLAQHLKASEKFAERQKLPAMANVEDVLSPFDALSHPEIRDLDLVTFLFGYHDTTFLGVDRARMDKAIFDSLKHGGILVVADHSAKPEDGAQVGKTFHRIAENTVKTEIEAAGFVFVEEGNFLRHPEDARTNAIFNNPTPVDEFVLKFRKP